MNMAFENSTKITNKRCCSLQLHLAAAADGLAGFCSTSSCRLLLRNLPPACFCVLLMRSLFDILLILLLLRLLFNAAYHHTGSKPRCTPPYYAVICTTVRNFRINNMYTIIEPNMICYAHCCSQQQQPTPSVPPPPPPPPIQLPQVNLFK